MVLSRSLRYCWFLLYAAAATASSAADYVLESVADDLATVDGADEAPVILSDGHVLYLYGHQLMKSDGQETIVVYEAAEDTEIAPYSVRSLSFNAAGDFVALCRAGSRQATIVRCIDGRTNLVDRRPALDLGPAAINDQGLVAYAVRTGEQLTHFMLHDGQTSRAIAKSRTLSTLNTQRPALNNRAEVAITSRSGVLLIITEARPATTRSIVSADPLGGFDGVAMNDAGQVVFRARRPNVALYRADQQGLKKIVDTRETFASLGIPSLNAEGQVAFHAVLDDGKEAIVVADDGGLSQVVASGDELNDSTITSLRFGTNGLNDRGQLAFWALLLDGTETVYRATPGTDQ